MDIVFLNGEYVSQDRAVISADDRGFTFGDGVYEVTPLFGGRALRMDARLARLRFGLEALRIDYDTAGVESIYAELLSRNGLSDARSAIVYLQVTRGAARRTHAFPPAGTRPTVYAYAESLPVCRYSEWEAGTRATTVSDSRWGRVDIKTLQLLPNVLAQEEARREGSDEAILIRDGIALEGARNNLFAVVEGVLRSHPPSNQILCGISRQLVLEVARERGYQVRELPTTRDQLGEATEVFLTGSTSGIRPIVSVDGVAVGDGRVGPVSRDLYDGFLSKISEECEIDLRDPASR